MHTKLWFTIISFNSMAAYIPVSALLLYRRPASWPYLFSLFNGLLVAFIDLGAGEVQVPALLLLAFTFFTGFASPHRAWRWGIITGIWVPVFQIVRMSFEKYPAVSPAEGWGSLIALGFALSGSYGGSIIRISSERMDRRDHSPPVPEAFANPEQTLAPQNLLNPQPGESPEGVQRGGGDGTPLVIPEAAPPPFVSVEEMPKIIRKVAPVYPELAIRANPEGTVLVKIWVDREGKPREALVVKSDADIFNDAATAAAMQFLFTPAYMNSGPVSVWVTIPFRFKLADRK